MKFSVGDKVRNTVFPSFGIGTVISITDAGCDRPIRVYWKDRSTTTYSIDGTQLDNTVRLVKITKLERAMHDSEI